MKAHVEIETLSAYLDREVDEPQRARIEAHLASCSDCQDKRLTLERSMKALADLPEVAPTRDESRAIRLRALQEVAPRLHPRRPWGRRVYVAAGALALVAAGIVGVSVLGSGGGDPEQAALAPREQGAPGGASDQVLAFSSSDEVLPAVTARPEVIRGVRRYRVADVRRTVPGALESAGEPAEDTATPFGEAESRAGRPEGSRSLPVTEVPPGEPVPGRSAQECLTQTLRSQPYPLIPLFSRAATFEGEPVWLLVYAWTLDEAPNAPLDQVQVWLVSRQDCQERYYSSFKP